jgi:hypothetical protein
MKPVVALSLGLLTMAAGTIACQGGTFGSSKGTFGSGSGTFGSSRAPGTTGASVPTFGRPSEVPSASAPRRPVFAPVQDIEPTDTQPAYGQSIFKPAKPQPVYSNRGGVDPYPAPAKPKGYVDVYGRAGR